ncbi:MAG: hypothetical protein Q7J16_03585 [Candidatus Cloacimonadales bacterium]|nr:hypothetical protein [Candidatus Cloacimonadales bacterium]
MKKGVEEEKIENRNLPNGWKLNIKNCRLKIEDLQDLTRSKA